MHRDLVLSADIGTTNLKFGIYDFQGNPLSFITTGNPFSGRTNGTQSAGVLYDALLEGIRVLTARSGLADRVAVVGIDGQMGGIVGVDRAWKAVIPFDPPINGNYVLFLKDALQRHGDLIVEETGSIPINGCKILSWLNEDPDSFEEVCKVLTIGGYAVGRLAGLEAHEALIDRTSTYLFGLGNGTAWSGKLCSLLGVPLELLPAIRDPVGIAGYLCDEAAARTGLTTGLPVTTGIGDTAASILGAGIVHEGDAVDIAGTCSVFGMCTSEDAADREHRALLRMESPVPDLRYLVGIGFGGEVHHWFTKEICRAEEDAEIIERLTREAESLPPGSEGLLFFPFLGGTFTPPDDRLRGTWIGLDWHHSLHHLYRSLLESIAYEYSHYISIYRILTGARECPRVTVTGSGRKNELLNRIKTDVLGSEYCLLHREDQENLGTALVAAAAVGGVGDLPAAVTACLGVERRVRPDRKKTEAYEPIVDRYLEYKRVHMDRLYADYEC